MKTTLARALKEKNRIAGRLRHVQELVRKENRKIKDSPRRLSPADLVAEAERLSEQLIAVKTVIAQANAGIVGTIIELEEVKSLLAFFREVPDDDDLEILDGRFGASRSIVEWEVALDKSFLLEKRVDLQERADALQDKLDEYNIRTKVTLPDNLDG